MQSLLTSMVCSLRKEDGLNNRDQHENGKMNV